VGAAAVEHRLHRRVAARERVADHHGVAVGRDVLRQVALLQADAQALELGRHRRIYRLVAAFDLVAQFPREGGDATHEGAGDAEDVEFQDGPADDDDRRALYPKPARPADAGQGPATRPGLDCAHRPLPKATPCPAFPWPPRSCCCSAAMPPDRPSAPRPAPTPPAPPPASTRIPPPMPPAGRPAPRRRPPPATPPPCPWSPCASIRAAAAATSGSSTCARPASRSKPTTSRTWPRSRTRRACRMRWPRATPPRSPAISSRATCPPPTSPACCASVPRRRARRCRACRWARRAWSTRRASCSPTR